MKFDNYVTNFKDFCSRLPYADPSDGRTMILRGVRVPIDDNDLPTKYTVMYEYISPDEYPQLDEQIQFVKDEDDQWYQLCTVICCGYTYGFRIYTPLQYMIEGLSSGIITTYNPVNEQKKPRKKKAKRQHSRTTKK